MSQEISRGNSDNLVTRQARDQGRRVRGWWWESGVCSLEDKTWGLETRGGPGGEAGEAGYQGAG